MKKRVLRRRRDGKKQHYWVGRKERSYGSSPKVKVPEGPEKTPEENLWERMKNKWVPSKAPEPLLTRPYKLINPYNQKKPKVLINPLKIKLPPNPPIKKEVPLDEYQIEMAEKRKRWAIEDEERRLREQERLANRMTPEERKKFRQEAIKGLHEINKQQYEERMKEKNTYYLPGAYPEGYSTLDDGTGENPNVIIAAPSLPQKPKFVPPPPLAEKERPTVFEQFRQRQKWKREEEVKK